MLLSVPVAKPKILFIKFLLCLRGRAGGYTMQLPSESHATTSLVPKSWKFLILLLRRTCREALVLGDISTGASNDIERATQTVRAMITKYGMTDELGPITYGSDNSEQSLVEIWAMYVITLKKPLPKLMQC